MCIVPTTSEIERFHRLFERAVQEEHEANTPSAQTKSKTACFAYLIRNFNDLPSTMEIRAIARHVVNATEWPIRIAHSQSPRSMGTVIFVFDYDPGIPAGVSAGCNIVNFCSRSAG